MTVFVMQETVADPKSIFRKLALFTVDDDNVAGAQLNVFVATGTAFSDEGLMKAEFEPAVAVAEQLLNAASDWPSNGEGCRELRHHQQLGEVTDDLDRAGEKVVTFHPKQASSHLDGAA